MKETQRRELVRKALHFLVALAAPLAAFHRPLTLILLAAGTLLYAAFETLRCRGYRIPLVSPLTDYASRRRDQGRFVLGPVTLGMGAFFSLLLLPASAADIAVFALAFGDGTASLAGKFFGRIRPPFLLGKSLEGSAACFISVFLSALAVSAVRGEADFRIALIAAAAATLMEALPVRDYDNIIIPLVTGFVVTLLQP